MNREEAWDLLYSTPKESVMDGATFDRVVALVESGTVFADYFHVNEFGEIVSNPQTVGDDALPTFRVARMP